MGKKIRFKPIQRKLRQRAKKVEKVVLTHQRKFFATSIDNLRGSRILIASWLVVVIALILIVAVQSYIFGREIHENVGVSGGTYAEGVIGEVSDINPLFAQTESEVAVSRLVYSPLFNYDSSNHLRGEVAESYNISSDGLTYDIKIREGLKWHDQTDLTVDDVIFTIGLIKNPDTTSHLYSTWRNIKVEKIDNHSLQFILRSPLASFPSALTFGILPKAELKDVAPAELREHISGNVTMGSGPYKYRSANIINDEQKTLLFTANHGYWRYNPKIENLYIENFSSSRDLLDGLTQGNVIGAVGLSTTEAKIAYENNNGEINTIPLNSGMFAIFNLNNVNDYNIRKALLLATNRPELRNRMSVGTDVPSELNTPIARGIYQSVDDLRQDDFNSQSATKMISDSNVMNVVALKDSDSEIVANILAEQWKSVGVDAKVKAVSSDIIQQSYLIPRNYDILISQLQLGADPDVYAYWHSSGIGPQGLNLANYNSPVADIALFGGRTALNVATREQRTKNFVEQWLSDIPAIALYQPNLYYLHRSDVDGITQKSLSDESNRFRDIYRWTVEDSNLYKTP